MRRVQKILLGVFLGGVLLGGIGTGVAFVEYSSITYAGEKKIGQESLVTEEFDFTFQPEAGGVMVVSRRYSDGQPCVLEEDASVPENMVRYQVTYNPDTVTPELVFHENEAESDQQQGDPEKIKYQGNWNWIPGIMRTASLSGWKIRTRF